MRARIASGKSGVGGVSASASGTAGQRGENADAGAVRGKQVDHAAGDTFSATPTAAGLRAGLRAARAALPAPQRAAADARIAAHLQAWLDPWLARRASAGLAHTVVAAFWPLGAEPDLRPSLAAFAGRPGLQWVLPCVVQRAAPLVFRHWTPATTMATGEFGILEPQGTPVSRPDLILAPLLGFTDEADRIGYGGGFYDRTLAALRDDGHAVTAIGVAYACGRLAPGQHRAEPHDMRLAAVVTEAGWVPGMPA